MAGLARVYVVEDAVASVVGAAHLAAPYETGGLMAGVRTERGLWVTTFLELRPTNGHRSRYAIPAGVTHASIDAIRERDERIGYLGDWHTHPADAGPSMVDLATLRLLAKGSLHRRRLLGIIRRERSGWQLELWSVGLGRVPGRVAYALTGPLPDG